MEIIIINLLNKKLILLWLFLFYFPLILISNDQNIKPWLGIGLKDCNGNVEGMDSGIIIMWIYNDSPAEKYGLRKNDIVTEFDGKTVVDTKHFRKIIAESKINKLYSINILRDEEKLIIDIKLEETEDTHGYGWSDSIPNVYKNNLVNTESLSNGVSQTNYFLSEKYLEICNTINKKYEKADILMQNNQYTNSLILLKEISEVDEDILRPNSKEYTNYFYSKWTMGDLYYLFEQYDLALKEYMAIKDVFKNDPVLYPNLFNNIAIIYYKLNNIDKAINILKDYLKNVEENNVIYYSLQYMYFNNKQYDEAISCGINACRQGLTPLNIIYNTGLCYLMKDDYSNSFKWYIRGLHNTTTNSTNILKASIDDIETCYLSKTNANKIAYYYLWCFYKYLNNIDLNEKMFDNINTDNDVLNLLKSFNRDDELEVIGYYYLASYFAKIKQIPYAIESLNNYPIFILPNTLKNDDTFKDIVKLPEYKQMLKIPIKKLSEVEYKHIVNNNENKLILQVNHTKQINCFSITPDGKYLLTGSSDKTIKKYNIKNDIMLNTFSEPTNIISSIDYNPLNGYILGISGHGYTGKKDLFVWDFDGGLVFGTNANITAGAFTENKNHIIYTELNDIKLYDFVKRKTEYVFKGHKLNVRCIDLKKAYIVSGSSDKTIKLWSKKKKKEIRDFVGHTAEINNVLITSDYNYLISTSEDYTVRIWNVKNGKEIKRFYFDKKINDIVLSYDEQYILFSIENVLYYLNLNKKKIVARITLDDTITSLIMHPSGEYILLGSYSGKINFIKWNGDSIKKIENNILPVKMVGLSQDEKYFSSLYSEKEVQIWDNRLSIQKRIPLKSIYSISFSRYTNLLLCSYSEDNSNFSEIYWYNTDGICRKNVRISNSSFDVRKKYINNKENLILRNKVLYDLNNGNEAEKIIIEDRIKKTNEDGREINDHGTFYVYPSDPDFMDLLKKFLEALQADATVGALSPDGKYLVSEIQNNKEIHLCSIKEKKVLRKFELAYGEGVSTICFSPNSKYLFIGNHIGDVYILSILNTKSVFKFKAHKSGITDIQFNTNNKYFATSSFDNDIKLWDINTKKNIKVFKGHNSAILNIEFYKNGDKLISSSIDGTMKIWNINNKHYASALSTDNNWIVYTPDGYWDGSRDAGSLVAMVKGLDAYGVDQFSLRNNRPDIILKRMGLGTFELISHYSNQYIKRLRKFGITNELQLSADMYVPEVEILNDVKAEGKFAKLIFNLKDDKFNLKKYNIYINDVPLFGGYGQKIAGRNITLTNKVELIKGKNKIEISCFNENGAESFRGLTFAEYDGKVKKNLYYLGFGVSKYKCLLPKDMEANSFKGMLFEVQSEKDKKLITSAYIKKSDLYLLNKDLPQQKKYRIRDIINRTDYGMELGYAHKDASDLGAVFNNMKEKYDNIYIKIFTNEQVTVDNIKKAKGFIKNAGVDDTFVLFIAGHGVHDNDKYNTYYYLTHESDVNDMPNTAANFELIEDIMQGIPPRNKLFLIDTCESGERDGSITVANNSISGERSIRSRAIKNGVNIVSRGDQRQHQVRKQLLNDENRYIYNDLNRRSGAIIFSSCKGNQSSAESDDIENGFFTEEIIKALKGIADINKDGWISTEELRAYVMESVPREIKIITGIENYQNPTVDWDNIYQKFGFPTVK